jgi:alpha-glucosidase
MLAGPLDYEPGFLNNSTRAQFRMIEKNPQSQGTRCHQLAMFVVYDNPLQIFSGNPSQASREESFMQLLGSIPTVWDETIIPDAKVGDFIITARKHGNDWFVAGMTDWSPREMELPLTFLDNGNYNATLCFDGVNAENYAADYLITKRMLTKVETIKIKMAPGGGFLIRLIKQ